MMNTDPDPTCEVITDPYPTCKVITDPDPDWQKVSDPIGSRFATLINTVGSRKILQKAQSCIDWISNGTPLSFSG